MKKKKTNKKQQRERLVKNKSLSKKRLIQMVTADDYKPLYFKELRHRLGLNKSQNKQLDKLLQVLISEGKLSQTKKGKYILPTVGERFVGQLIVNPKGFGFVVLEQAEGLSVVEDENQTAETAETGEVVPAKDIFIPPNHLANAFHGDKVVGEYLVTTRRKKGNDEKTKRQEGRITKVLERAVSQLVGTYTDNNRFGFVVPDNSHFVQDIYIDNKNKGHAKSRQKVVVELLSYGDKQHKPEGKIVEVLGDAKSTRAQVTGIVRSYDLPNQFPEEVLAEVANIPDIISADERKGRLDLRKTVIVTIDGEDAKDLDDGISISREGDNYRLGVHIADVSHYVKEKQPLDVEAIKRGTSNYLVDRVIPMLPKKLSNGLCSLNAGEDRLALSCLMTISPRGKVIDYEIAETVIRVNERFSYKQVAALLEPERYQPNRALVEEYAEYLPMLRLMAECAKQLNQYRERRGAIDFDFTEAKFVLDNKERVIDVKPYERNMATKLIEAFMLLANETVAEHYHRLTLPFLYRVHEKPKEERIDNLAHFIEGIGYHLDLSKEIKPKDLQRLLVEIEGKPEESMVSRLILRSMQQAKYTTVNQGHFGLATHYYTHFTSPIRRYPDLQIHRIIKESLAGQLTPGRVKEYQKRLPTIANKASELERRSEEAEREVHKFLKVVYMEKKLGQVFSGRISGVTAWGLYVELPNTVEGLIPMMKLVDDDYLFDESSYQLTGQETGRTFRLGQKIMIRVVNTDRQRKTIDFVTVEKEE